MRMRTRLLMLAAALSAPGVAPGQAANAAHPVSAALEHGQLVVWLVSPGTAAERARIIIRKQSAQQVPPSTSEERTLAEFGTASSNVGQTAGSYGQTAGTLGKAASDTGRTAGSYGQASGSVGTSASDAGQTAGSYGQTAGSYGQTAGSIGESSATLNAPVRSPGPGAGAVAAQPTVAAATRDRARANLAHEAEVFSGLDLKLVDVVSEDLKEKLAAAAGTAEYPDVVLANALPGWWAESDVGLAMLGTPNGLDPTDLPDDLIGGWRLRPATVMRRAPHPAAARAFVVWLRDGEKCSACELAELDGDKALTAQVAIGALRKVLAGERLGSEADPDAAQFSADLAQRLAWFTPAEKAMHELDVRVDVFRAAAHGQLAVVLLRAVGSSPDAFGVVHALVVLRRGANGAWKVLQISPNLALPRWGSGLRIAASRTAVEKLAGISLASPPDGDIRQPSPELWWDNGGGAALLVVEWQRKLGAVWSDSRLMQVPDNDFRVKTRVTASFAASAGEYKWRVWAVGRDEAVVLSPWRRLTIVP